MKERPILFQGAMVRALLAGTKTQTRRVCKPAEQNSLSFVTGIEDPRERGQRPLEVPGSGWFGDEEGELQFFCPYGARGDRLWVRETWMDVSGTGVEARDPHTKELTRYAYAADHPAGSYSDQCRKDYGLKWKPSIHMPRRACRLVLDVTDVRVERLQDISRGDAMDEGCPFPNMAQGDDPRQWYAALWDTINGPGGWDANPWVWTVSFKRATP